MTLDPEDVRLALYRDHARLPRPYTPAPMNVVFLSPHFPPSLYLFCARLRELGATVLGVADAPYESLRPELREALTEYYRVPDLHDLDALVRALGHFTHRHGKLDRIDSLNEYWLETEARLRTEFNIPGLRVETIGRVKRKSAMKRVFERAGVPAARGRVVRTAPAARDVRRRGRLPGHRQAGRRRRGGAHLPPGERRRPGGLPRRPAAASTTSSRRSSPASS